MYLDNHVDFCSRPGLAVGLVSRLRQQFRQGVPIMGAFLQEGIQSLVTEYGLFSSTLKAGGFLGANDLVCSQDGQC